MTNNQRVFSSNFFVLKFRGDSALDDPMILNPESCHETNKVMGMMPPCWWIKNRWDIYKRHIPPVFHGGWIGVFSMNTKRVLSIGVGWDSLPLEGGHRITVGWHDPDTMFWQKLWEDDHPQSHKPSSLSMSWSNFLLPVSSNMVVSQCHILSISLAKHGPWPLSGTRWSSACHTSNWGLRQS